MTKFNVEAEINGQPAPIVKRNIDSPAVADSILFIDDLGIKAENADFTQDCVVTLRLKRTPGT